MVIVVEHGSEALDFVVDDQGPASFGLMFATNQYKTLLKTSRSKGLHDNVAQASTIQSLTYTTQCHVSLALLPPPRTAGPLVAMTAGWTSSLGLENRSPELGAIWSGNPRVGATRTYGARHCVSRCFGLRPFRGEKHFGRGGSADHVPLPLCLVFIWKKRS